MNVGDWSSDVCSSDLNISGVGEKKAARYGNAFLRIIEDAVGSRE